MLLLTWMWKRTTSVLYTALVWTWKICTSKRWTLVLAMVVWADWLLAIWILWQLRTTQLGVMVWDTLMVHALRCRSLSRHHTTHAHTHTHQRITHHIVHCTPHRTLHTTPSVSFFVIAAFLLVWLCPPSSRCSFPACLGMFQQNIFEGFQAETPDTWLKYGNPWEITRFDVKYMIRFYGEARGVSHLVTNCPDC